MYGTASRTWPVQSRRHKDTTAGRQHADPYSQALYEFRRAFKDIMCREPDCALEVQKLWLSPLANWV